jgi:hypothetical protein
LEQVRLQSRASDSKARRLQRLRFMRMLERLDPFREEEAAA